MRRRIRTENCVAKLSHSTHSFHTDVSLETNLVQKTIEDLVLYVDFTSIQVQNQVSTSRNNLSFMPSNALPNVAHHSSCKLGQGVLEPLLPEMEMTLPPLERRSTAQLCLGVN